jgi:hypothetical protein
MYRSTAGPGAHMGEGLHSPTTPRWFTSITAFSPSRRTIASL